MISSRPRLAALILAVTGVPLIALFSLGWWLLDLDRAQEQRRAESRLEQSARLVLASLQAAVSVSRQQLAAGTDEWPLGAIAVTFRNDAVVARPASRLAYVPAVRPM